MEAPIPDKAYFRIGEVSHILGLEPYVIRYWESEFKSIKPERTKSDQRLYRRKDLDELILIKNLLYEEQFTILGAKRHLAKMRDRRGEGQEELRNRQRLIDIKKGLQKLRDILN
jgi:DNA-binding transcriptional MerR regulator